MPFTICDVRLTGWNEEKRARWRKAWWDEEVKKREEEEHLIARFKKEGRDYYEVMMEREIQIPIPNNIQEWDVEHPDPLCYLCRSLVAMSSAGDCWGVLGTTPDDQYSFNAWDTCNSKAHKPHFVCFDCRKAWKPMQRSGGYLKFYPFYSFHYDEDKENQYRTPAIIEATEKKCKIFTMRIPEKTRCSTCRKPGTYMGLNFRTPAKNDIKGWKRAKAIYEENPTAFEASCHCNTYRKKSKENKENESIETDIHRNRTNSLGYS